MLCCLHDAETIYDIPIPLLARFFRLLAEAQETSEEPELARFWSSRGARLADFFGSVRGDLSFAEVLATHDRVTRRLD